jgi:hypothetical protein
MIWFDDELPAAGETDVVIAEGIKRGDVLELEYNTGDPFTADDSKVEYIGVDAFEAERKAEEDAHRAEEEEKNRQEAQKAYELKKKELFRKHGKGNRYIHAWIERLMDPESEQAKAICAMPLFNGGADKTEDFPDEEDLIYGPAIWLTKQKQLMTEDKFNLDLPKDHAISVILTAQDVFGYVVWSEELLGKHGRDWKQLEKAA